MRTANVLKATRQIADEALYRSSLGGGGGGSGPLPAATFTIVVNKGGNDATGDGTDEKPFLTIAHAMTVATSISPTFDQPALIQVGPGGYTENLVWPPNVIVSGLDASTLGFFLNGSITLNHALWVAAGATNLVLGGLDACEVGSNVTLDFTGVNAGGFFGQFFFGAKTNVDGNLSVTGDTTGVVGALFIIQTGSTIGGTAAFVGASVETNLTLFGGATSFASSATVVTSWQSFGDVINGIALSINASAGQNVNVNLIGTGAGAGTTLTLTDGGGGVTSFTATAGGIPSTVTLVGGAAPPVPASPLVGLNSKNATGAAAPVGAVATADGASGITWTPAAFPFSLPSRGMTAFLNGDNGVFNTVSTVVTEWFDLAPSRVGQFWSTDISGPTTPGTFNPAGFNGKATVDTVENPGTPNFYQAEYISSLNLTARTFVQPQQFTLAACVEYTGTINYSAPVFNLATCPMIWGSVRPAGSAFPVGCGLLCGIDPGNPANVIFAAFVCIFNVSLFFAQSVSVPKNVAHYVAATFMGGNITLYLDALAPVVTGGVPPMLPADLATAPWQTSGNTAGGLFQGHNRDLVTYNVGLSASEVAALRAFLKSDGGL